MLEDVDKIRGTKLSECDQGLGAGINRLVQDLFGQPVEELGLVYGRTRRGVRGISRRLTGCAYSGIAGATIGNIKEEAGPSYFSAGQG